MFLAILGHDLRTPLGAIMMSATGLLMSPDLGQPQQAAASRILNSGTRIKGIVNDLLDFTRTRLGAGIPLACADAGPGGGRPADGRGGGRVPPGPRPPVRGVGPGAGVVGRAPGSARRCRTWSATPSSTARRSRPSPSRCGARPTR